jgi:hypothetical protein
MDEQTYLLITEAINWLKNPCVIDAVKIQKALSALKSVSEIKPYYNSMYIE